MIPLIKTQNMMDEAEGSHVAYGPTEPMQILGHEWDEFKLQRRQPEPTTHVPWIRRTETCIPTVTRFYKGRPVRIRLTNATDRLTSCPVHFPVIVWVPIGSLPKTEGYVWLDSAKYKEWQVLAHAAARDKTLLKWEAELYQQWLAKQPPAVEQVRYPTPKGILQRPDEDSADKPPVNSERDSADDSSATGDSEWIAEEHHRRLDATAGDSTGVTTTDDEAMTPEAAGSGLETAESTVRRDEDQGLECSPKRHPPMTQTAPSREAGDISTTLDQTFIAVMRVLATEGTVDSSDETAEHPAADIELEDYAHELAFLPDLSEPEPTTLDYSAANVKNPELSADQQRSLIEVLRRHESIMIASGNARPPPAYGVVCDIDVQGHAPIKQRARRIPFKHLKKLYELRKGLLKAGLIAFSDSPWASLIVIVLKKNGQDIRLCIDYKMVNAVTAILEYVMPLVDDLLTDLETYLWFCSLDAASGFWAILMTLRARKISAFVCPLGHFEWLRMPFGLKNAPMIYQRMIDNALWGFVQPKGGWNAFAAKMKAAEDSAEHCRRLESSPRLPGTTATTRTKFAAARDDSKTAEPITRLINSPEADMFTTNEADESSLVPVFDRRSFVDDICFGGEDFLGALNYYNRFIQDFAVYGAALYQLKEDDFAPEGDLTVARRSFQALQDKVAAAPILRHFVRTKDVHIILFANEWALSSTLLQLHDDKLHPVRFCGRVLKEAEMNYHAAEKEVLALLLLLKTCYTQLAGRTIRVYTRFSTLEWITKSKSLFGRAVQFAVLLSLWHLIVQRVKEKDCAFTQLLQSTVTNFVDLDYSLELVAPPTKGSPPTRMDPNVLYARLPTTHTGFVVSFDVSAKTEKYGGYGSCSWIVWSLPEWKIVIAANAYLEKTTVNIAEYTGMNNGVLATIEHGAEDLVVVGDSRLAIQQSLGVIACRKESPMAQLNHHKEITARLRSVKYLHVVREYNAAADSLATEALESKVSKVILSETRKAELAGLNRIQEVIYESPPQGSEAQNLVPGGSIQTLSGVSTVKRKTFADFVRPKPGMLLAMTRAQTKSKKKHVRFTHDKPKPLPKTRPNRIPPEIQPPETTQAPPAAPNDKTLILWKSKKKDDDE
ncbi:reverse transcriptase [Phytophthora cinnamomi]|uniref:reverse transcriptase n=1 Tax=Phytophthora cinnamomi TaxID=4785 RepID=UPI00355A29F4|nr:reverse transcriptase [Phytophthora cinnamomi]